MAGPWEQYAAAAPAAAGPWDKYMTPAPAKTAPARSWSDVPGDALSNLPSSAGNFISGIAQAVMHPIDTVQTIGDIGYGAVRNAVPAAVGNLMDRADGTASDPKAAAATLAARGKADATGKFFKDRYGSAEGLKNTLATDPVGVASDAAAVLSGGAGLAGKVGLSSMAGPLRAAATAVNPLTPVIAGALKAAPVVGNALANMIGGLGTHTGAESIKQAYRSGREGGQSAQALTDNMRGNVPMTDVLDAAKANLQEMGRAKSEAYRAGMAQVSSDQTVLNFNGIDRAVQNAGQEVRFGDQVKNVKGAAVQQQIADEIANWKALDPAQYHTPEGLDALKQKIGGIVDSIPYEEKVATRVGTQMYNAVKSEIVSQAPSYAKTMREYTEASEQIREIERALSLGNRAAADTAMRKLQSLTRNNANTNYGNRLDLARQLEQQGGRELMPALAGQALTSWTPRGLSGAVAGASGVGGYLAGGVPLAAGALAVQSPRLMGETALAAGKGARVVGNAANVPLNALTGRGISPVDLANYLSQGGRLSDMTGGQ